MHARSALRYSIQYAGNSSSDTVKIGPVFYDYRAIIRSPFSGKARMAHLDDLHGLFWLLLGNERTESRKIRPHILVTSFELGESRNYLQETSACNIGCKTDNEIEGLF